MKSLPMFTPQAAKPFAPTVALDRRVLLICMPFQLIDNSPLAPALLATVLAEGGFPTNELYFHLEFARLLEFHVYDSAISDLNWLPELLFAEQMHDISLPPDVAAAMDARFGVRSVRDARFAAFAASCMATLAAQPVPDLVGFTTTFYQFIPSVWMAREIRKLWPSAKLVFGGGRCDSPMGEAVHRLYPEIDYVIGGRGERLLLDLVRSDPWPASSFMFDREGAPLDSLPVVDYDTFITQINRVMPVEKRVAAFDEGRADETRSPEEAEYWSRFDLKLNYESSKGCWYGEKVHCKFCGLGSNMKYSAKPASRTLREIDQLWDRYGQNLMATDAIISLDYFKELLPTLATREGKRPRLFYEIKANVTRAQVRLLREANVREVQPGIESLSSKHLRLMAKGVSAIQNIALLKWGREEGVSVNWNYLCGIPGETAEDYLTLREILPHLVQLDPPTGLRQIRLDRYSPYFNKHEEFGWSKVAPNRIFRLLHPDFDDDQTASIAWRFESVGTSTVAPLADYFDETASAIADWQRRHARGEGLFWHREHGLLRKHDGEIDQYEPTPTLTSIIERSNIITTAANLMRDCEIDEETLEGLVDDGILFREGDKVINVAVDCTSSRAASPPAGAS